MYLPEKQHNRLCGQPAVRTFPITIRAGRAGLPFKCPAVQGVYRGGFFSKEEQGDKAERWGQHHLKHISISYGSCNMFSPLTVSGALKSTAWNL